MEHRALETGSGIAWAEWLEILEPHKDLDHPAMAAKVLEHINARGASKSPEWWAQGVTVAYEQHIGRRGVGGAVRRFVQCHGLQDDAFGHGRHPRRCRSRRRRA